MGVPDTRRAYSFNAKIATTPVNSRKPTGISTWYWNPARSTLARCSGPVYAVRAAAGVAPPRSGGSARTCPIPHDKPLRRSRTTERPEQRPDPRRERPRRDSQAHHQERLRHATSIAIVVLFITTPPSKDSLGRKATLARDAVQVAGGVHSINAAARGLALLALRPLTAGVRRMNVGDELD